MAAGIMATGGRDNGSSASIVKRSLSPENLETLSKDELISRLGEMKLYVEELENRGEVRSQDGRLRMHQAESQRRENVLFMRLTAKEQEVQEFLSQLEELRTSLGGGLRNALLDPVVNSIFQKMREELKLMKEKTEQSQEELNAWKFTPDSSTGKRLMAKCKSLIQENEELGRAMESGKFAQLEGELKLSQEQRRALVEGQAEVDEFLGELDEDMEGLQATVVYLQKQLEDSRKENQRLREIVGERTTLTNAGHPPQRTPGEFSSETQDSLAQVLTDNMARRSTSALRRHEAAAKQKSSVTLTFVEEPDGDNWSRGDESSISGALEDNDEGDAVMENGRRTPADDLGESNEPPPASPPPRKMPRLDNSGGSSVGHYSPKSPELAPGMDSNLEEEDIDGEMNGDDSSNRTAPPHSDSRNKMSTCGKEERRTRKEAGNGLGLFDKFSLTTRAQNGIVEAKKSAKMEH